MFNFQNIFEVDEILLGQTFIVLSDIYIYIYIYIYIERERDKERNIYVRENHTRFGYIFN